MSTRIQVNGLNRLLNASPLQSAPTRTAMFNDIARIYMNFLRDRYAAFSRGGGNWAPLKPSTIRRKAGTKQPGIAGFRGGKGRFIRIPKSGKRRAALILIASGNLFSNIQINGRDVRLTTTTRSMTIQMIGRSGKLMAIHANGGRHLPRRVIMVAPDQRTLQKINGAMLEAAKRQQRSG